MGLEVFGFAHSLSVMLCYHIGTVAQDLLYGADAMRLSPSLSTSSINLHKIVISVR